VPRVIEWTEARKSDIVWRYPVDEINWGDNLIVHEYEKLELFLVGE